MTYSIVKVSDEESRFIWSRLILQTSDIMRFTTLDEEARGAMLHACEKTATSLSGCYGTFRRVRAYQQRVLQEWEAGGQQRYPQPLLEDLELDVGRYTYDAKNTLRDATGILAGAFKVNLKEASVFARRKAERCRAVELLMPVLGKNHVLIQHIVTSEEGWLAEMIMMRNTVEHPNGDYGSLRWDNFTFSEDGVRLPQWRRIPPPPELPQNPTLISQDMEMGCALLLDFCEGLLICALRHYVGSPIFHILADPAVTAWDAFRRFEVYPDVSGAIAPE